MRPNYLNQMSWAFAEVYGAATDRILINLAKYFPYINDSKQLRGSWEYQARMLAKMGQVSRETVDILASSLAGGDAALRKSLEAAIVQALRNEEPKLRQAAMNGMLNGGVLPPAVDPGMTQAFKAYYAQASDKLNLVNTVMLDSTEQLYQQTVADAAQRLGEIQRALNTETGNVITGVSTYNQAMRDTVRRMVDNGITGFIDHGGHHWSPEAYVAMDIKSTMFNTARAAIWERNQQYGNDLYQVSSHLGARPLCYPWQGKVISNIDAARDVHDLDGNTVHAYAQSETSYGQAAGLFGVNCGHYPIPFIDGVSVVKDPPQDEEENAKAYAESQQQRALERKLREERRDLAVLKAQGADQQAIDKQKARVDKASDDIDDFCDTTGRTRRKDREYTPINATWPEGNPPTDNPPRPNAQMHLGPNDIPPTSQAVALPPVAEVSGPRHVEFTPAKTIQEAEERARQFVSSMGSVSYKGIDIDYANACNRVLADIQATFDVDPLGSIQPMNKRQALFRTSTAEAAYRWGGIGGDLFINPTYYKSGKAFAEHKAEIDRLMQVVLSGGDKLLQTASGSKREYIQALLTSGRQCVSQSYDFVEGTFVHESGHRLDDWLFRKAIREAFGASNVMYAERLTESRRQYGAGLSGYAVTSNNEYIAESFTAWWFGEKDKIDPVIRGVFEAAVKK